MKRKVIENKGYMWESIKAKTRAGRRVLNAPEKGTAVGKREERVGCERLRGWSGGRGELLRWFPASLAKRLMGREVGLE